MNRKVRFGTNNSSIASSVTSPFQSKGSGSSNRAGKRKIGDTTEETIEASSRKRDGEKSPKRRKVSVYDAVAGRAGRNGFLPTEATYSKDRDTASSSARPVAPDDILFNRRGARIRTAEESDYLGVDDLGPVPPSDLLETIHRYVSRFYGRRDIERSHLHFKSMDGTALLALGILLEEAVEHSLGETGHLAFLTTAEEEEMASPTIGWDGHSWVKKASRRAQSFRSAHVEDSPSHDDLDDEAHDILENEDDDEQSEEKWQSSSPASSVKDMEPRTESPQRPHDRSSTNSHAVNSASSSGPSQESIASSAAETQSPRNPGVRRLTGIDEHNGFKGSGLQHSSNEDESSDREDLYISGAKEETARNRKGGPSKRVYSNTGYKSTAMVQSSDEDEDEGTSSQHDYKMEDVMDPTVGRASASPQTSSTSSDTDDVELKIIPASVMAGRRNAASEPGNAVSRRSSRSEASVHSRESVELESEATDEDSEGSSEPENDGAAANAIAPAFRGESDHEQENISTKISTRKEIAEDRPEDKMAKFKKSMDDLLDRLMAQ